MIDGLILNQLKIIEHPKGNVLHGIKRSDSGFVNFGEAYFSTINKNDIKSWKKHLKMTLNFIVPIGEIKFVIYDDRTLSKTKGFISAITLSEKKYYRLTVPPDLWVAFKGINKKNLLLNLADIEHDPDEILRCDLNKISYNW